MIKRYLLRYSWALWVGGAVGALYNSYFLDWQWWLFVCILVFLIILHDYGIRKELDDKSTQNSPRN